MKINLIKIKNFRGARREASLVANQGRSILLYGDNGTGKSSFLDAFEWFIWDKVSHLNKREIEKHGGLKHILSENDKESYVEIQFTNALGNKKILEVKKDKTKAFFEKEDNKFQLLLKDFKREKIWLRYTDLVQLVLENKSDRLIDISNMIGYERVTKIREELKKSVRRLKKEIEYRGLEAILQDKQRTITDKLSEIVNDQSQFYSAINDLTSKYFPEITVKDRVSYKEILDKLKKTTNKEKIILHSSLEEICEKIKDFLREFQAANKCIDDYSKEIKKYQKSSEKIKNISLINLYNEAENILSIHEEDNCPLCLREIKREDLIKIISSKLKELKYFKKKKEDNESTKNHILNELRGLYGNIKEIKNSADKIKDKLEIKMDEFSIKMKELKSIISEIEEDIFDVDINKIFLKQDFSVFFANTLSSIKKFIKDSPSDDNDKMGDLNVKINLAYKAFNEFLEFKRQKKSLENKLETLEKITSDFKQKEKQGISSFLAKVSDDLNEFFVFMNNDKRVSNIELAVANNSNNEFIGIDLKIDFYSERTPPQKFLSESYINSLGLSLFLSSVKAFNKKAKFLFLDDVISSFDEPHRLKFSQLLQEKFSDYQIIVLTHERKWFDLMSHQVKGKGWHITSTIWTDVDGTQLKIPSISLREQIEKKNTRIRSGRSRKLNTEICRKYFERIKLFFKSELSF